MYCGLSILFAFYVFEHVFIFISCSLFRIVSRKLIVLYSFSVRLLSVSMLVHVVCLLSIKFTLYVYYSLFVCFSVFYRVVIYMF